MWARQQTLTGDGNNARLAPVVGMGGPAPASLLLSPTWDTAMAYLVEAMLVPGNKLSLSWNDKGSGGVSDLQTYQVPSKILPQGFRPLGDHAESAISVKDDNWIYGTNARQPVVVLKDVSTPPHKALVQPDGQLVAWNAGYKKNGSEGYFFRYTYSDTKYITLGLVVGTNNNPPPWSNYWMVHMDILMQSPGGTQLWSTYKSDAKKNNDYSIWAQSVYSLGVNQGLLLPAYTTGNFVGTGTLNKPAAGLFWTLHPAYVIWRPFPS